MLIYVPRWALSMATSSEPLTAKNLPERIWIAAGARDGDRVLNLSEALRRLATRGVAIVRLSSVYETEPVDLPGDRPLLNGVLEVTADLPPERLMEVCLEVERTLGRRREAGAPGPRPIDLDILLYGRLVLETARLSIPHPRMHLRRFVLTPLVEIAPDAWHPVLQTTAAALLRRCRDRAWVRPAATSDQWRR